MNFAVEVSRRGGQRHRRLTWRPVMQLNSALARHGAWRSPLPPAPQKQSSRICVDVSAVT